MSMLAEPRRRKRTLNLRGKNEWSDDQNKFGQKMLEKMGWAPGKGLGLNLDGSIDHVKVRFKDNNGGVGFKDRNDQWTVHEDNFNGLLKSLHGGPIDSTKLHSDVSLEEKSKKSQSRVHYKKFTKGKDITQYTAKDLANIFGKKTLAPEGSLKETKGKPGNEIVGSDGKHKTSQYNLIAAGSMKDYFKSKLGNKLDKKPLRNLGCKEIIDEPIVTNYEPDSDIVFKGFCGTQNQCDVDSQLPSTGNTHSFSFYPNKPHFDLTDIKVSKPFSFYPEKSMIIPKTNEDVDKKSRIVNLIDGVHDGNIESGKSKKKKRNKQVDEADSFGETDLTPIMTDPEVFTKSKKKKLKPSDNYSPDLLLENESLPIINKAQDTNALPNVDIKNKSRRQKKCEPSEQICNSNEDVKVVQENSVIISTNAENSTSVLAEAGPQKSIKRKKSADDHDVSVRIEALDDVQNMDANSTKNKKQKKNVGFSLEDNKMYNLDQSSTLKKLKKKKKNVLGCL